MVVSEKSNRVKPDEGVHAARLIRIVDQGTQNNEKFGTEARKIRITFELVDHKHVFKEENGEQPFLQDRQYTLSLNSKATLRKDIEAWRGKAFTEDELADGFDMDALLDTAGQVQITYSEDGKYANIGSLMAVAKGAKTSEAENTQYLFSLDEFDPIMFSDFPDWLQKVIADSPEYTAATTPSSDGDTASMSDITG